MKSSESIALETSERGNLGAVSKREVLTASGNAVTSILELHNETDSTRLAGIRRGADPAGIPNSTLMNTSQHMQQHPCYANQGLYFKSASWASWMSFLHISSGTLEAYWTHCMWSGLQCTDNHISCRTVVLSCSSPEPCTKKQELQFTS